MSSEQSGAGGRSDADPSLYNAYVAGLTVNNIEVVRVFADRLTGTEATEVKFDTALGYAQHEDAINYRYDVTARLVDAADDEAARIELAVVISTTSAAPADESVVARFAGTSGAIMAFPFLREGIATTAQRIGFAGVIMPIIRTAPAAVEDQRPAEDL